jgi:hypothetical protein
MTESRNIFDLLGKIEWEGGLGAAMEYGLHDVEDYDVPDEVKELWEEAATMYCEWEALADELQDALNRAENRYNEEKGF